MPSEPAEELIPAAVRVLCRLVDLPENTGKGFPSTSGRFAGLLAIRQGEIVRVYVNACPHIGTPLDWVPDRFLSADGTRIVCATHGAEFRIADGMCLRGPCRGETLEAVAARIEDGWVLVSETPGSDGRPLPQTTA